MLDSLMLKWLRMPEDASAHGYEIDNMMALVHWVMLLLLVGWSVFFLFTLVRFRKSKHPVANYKGVQNPFSKYLEAAVVVVEAILLVGFAFPIWAKVVHAFPSPADKNTVIVKVTAEQFAWNVLYPSPDGTFAKQDIKFLSTTNPLGLDPKDPNTKTNVTTLNQLHLPVGKPAIIHLTSKDVIHSFKVYQMRVNQDAIPGMDIPAWFTPVKTGQYEIVCAQLCGLGHYRMRGFLTVQTQEEYDKWLKEQREANKGGEEW